MWVLTARGAQEDDAPALARVAASAHAKVAKAKVLRKVKTREGIWPALLWSPMVVRLLVWTIGYCAISHLLNQNPGCLPCYLLSNK